MTNIFCSKLEKRVTYWLLCLSVITLNACIPLYKHDPLPDEQLRVTLQAFRLYQKSYVDEVNNRDLVKGAINGMLKSIDEQKKELPHEIIQYLRELADTDIENDLFKPVSDAYVIIQSQHPLESSLMSYAAIRGMKESIDLNGNFLTPEEVKEILAENNNEFFGIGIEISLKDKILTIVRPIDGGPGERAGLLPGDQILDIDGKSTENIINPIDAARMLRGQKGSQIALKIKRNKESFELILKREKVFMPKIKVQDYNAIGYIRIAQFYNKITDEILTALNDVISRRLKGLVIDLRGNTGGLLIEAVSSTELFLDKGRLITYTSGRTDESNLQFTANKQPFLKSIPIVLLVNKGTASGSEILAAALQDWNRATIIGNTTLGMASIQTLYPLDDGSMLRLTTARFFTPKGQTVQDKGIIPDVLVEGPEDIIERSLTQGNLKYDKQLQKAIEILSTEKQPRL